MDDVDLNAGVVYIRKSLQKVNGKAVLVAPKSQKRRRPLVLPEVVTSALKAHRVKVVYVKLCNCRFMAEAVIG